MFQQTVELKKNEKNVRVLFLGDLHIGSKGYRSDIFDKILSELEDRNTYWIGLGDYAEFRECNSKFYDYNNSPNTPGEQIEVFFSKIRKYTSRCLGLHNGNHEMGLVKKIGIDPVKQFCLDNKIAYLGGVALTTLKCGNKSIRICTTHGAGGGTKIGSPLNKITDYLFNFDADVIVCGHHHRLAYNVSERGFNDELGHYRWKPTHVILNGACLQSYVEGYSIYSENMLLDPTALGYSYFTLDDDFKPIVRLVPIQ